MTREEEIREMAEYPWQYDRYALAERLDYLLKENQRLREALEEIVSSHVEVENHFNGIPMPEPLEVRIARQALVGDAE